MRIGIHAQVAAEEELRGVGYHVVNLLDALSRVDAHNEYFLYYRRDLLGREGRSHPFPKAPNFHPRPVRFPGHWVEEHPRVWWDHYLPLVLRHDRIDVFHGPCHFLPAFAPGRTAVTIHDLAYFKLDIYPPGVTSALRQWTTKALREAGLVIAISENTRVDLEAQGVDPEKIRLIYGGGHVVPESRIAYDRQEELRRAYNLPEHFVLFVGTIGLRKNLPHLLRAFAAMKREGGLPHGLVLVGKRYTAAEQVDELIRELGLERDVIVTGYAEAWQVPLFYKMADLFVLPSLYEGFGMILFEAMAYGVPTVATDTSSIREVTGDAALLVAVDDVEALADAMRRALTDQALRSRMVAQGLERARLFTWDRSAEQTLAVYRDLAEPPARRAGRPSPAPALAR